MASEEKLTLISRAGEALAHAADLERQLQDTRTRYAQQTREREKDVSSIPLYYLSLGGQVR